MTWITLTPNAETLAWAKHEEQLIHDRGSRFDTGHRYAGPLGERAVHAWLTKQQVPHVVNGGVDDKPDVELQLGGNPIGVSVKTRVGFTPTRPHFGVVHPMDQMPHGEQIVFCVYEEPNNRLLIVGAIATVRFFAMGKIRRVGDSIGPRTRARHPCVQMPITSLTDPQKWLAAMRRVGSVDAGVATSQTRS